MSVARCLDEKNRCKAKKDYEIPIFTRLKELTTKEIE